MYMSEKPYAEQIRIPTDKASDNAVVRKHSELKKPYLSDTYEEMEHFVDPIIPFIPDPWPPFPWDDPTMGTPVPVFDDPFGFVWGKTFFCTVSPEDCYCEDGEKCFNLKCSHEIIGVAINSSGGWQVQGSGPEICVTAPEGASGTAEIDVSMREFHQTPSPHFIFGAHIGIPLSACRPNECCDTTTEIAWDDDNSDDTIERPDDGVSTAALAITGSATPFSWSVSGTGFTLDYSTTTGTSNTLNADNTACGAATITVTGCNGFSTTGYVRCITGTWVFDSTYPEHDEIADCGSCACGGGAGTDYFSAIHRIVHGTMSGGANEAGQCQNGSALSGYTITWTTGFSTSHYALCMAIFNVEDCCEKGCWGIGTLQIWECA